MFGGNRDKTSKDFMKEQKKSQKEQEGKEKEAKEKQESKDQNANTEKGDAAVKSLFKDAKYEEFAPQDDVKLGNF
jgi:hypothetical protein